MTDPTSVVGFSKDSPAAPEAASPPLPAAPVAEPDRLIAMDFLRGVAIFGILMVNMQFFALPFMEAVYPQDKSAWSTADEAAYYFVKVFFEFKFISTFSLLFGAGLIVQWTRATSARRSFAGLYYRRIAILAAVGLAHGVLLWHGDILFIYACIGSLLYLFRRARPRTLFWIAGILLAFAMILTAGFVGLEIAMESTTESTATVEGNESTASDVVPDPEGDSPVDSDPGTFTQGESASQIEDLDAQASDNASALGAIANASSDPARGFDAMKAAEWDPARAEWAAGETLAYREGPWADAMAFRAVSFAMALVFTIVGFGWHIMAMFLIGAALMKLGFFTPERRDLQARMARIFLPIGLVFEIANAAVTASGSPALGWEDMPSAVLHEIGAATLCLGYVALGALIATSPRSNRPLAPIRAVGRMALSTYLLSTIVTTFFMYHWGLKWFGTLGRAELVLLVPAIYFGLLAVSVFWLRWFRFGPFEWLWRSLTYWKLQPMVRSEISSEPRA